MKYGDKLYTVDDFIDGDFYTKKRSAKNLTACFFLFVFCFFFRMRLRCTMYLRADGSQTPY